VFLVELQAAASSGASDTMVIARIAEIRRVERSITTSMDKVCAHGRSRGRDTTETTEQRSWGSSWTANGQWDAQARSPRGSAPGPLFRRDGALADV
jgi:hypothetical protein